jgi:hypothetical protein
MTGLLILLALFAVPYVGFNIRRLRRGRRWAFTVCQVAKEWEKREYDKRVARRAAARSTRSPDRV